MLSLKLKEIKLGLKEDNFINKLKFEKQMENKSCSSCKKKTDNDKGCVTFNCPQCGKFELVRCTSCRKSAVKYTCPECNFVGPN